MTEVLQRRLVGALVLIALALVLASLLPDVHAPARHDGARVVTYDLGTGLRLDEGSPAPPRETPAPSAAQARSPIQLQESLALSSDTSWYAQVGSFENQANAHAAQARLRQYGLPATIQAVRVGEVQWYRVRVGPYPAEKQAQNALGMIRRKGYDGAKLVRPETQ